MQELITYLASFIRSSGTILDGIMRVRTHFFIIAMREEIIRMKGCDEDEAIECLMDVCAEKLLTNQFSCRHMR